METKPRDFNGSNITFKNGSNITDIVNKSFNIAKQEIRKNALERATQTDKSEILAK